MSERRGYWEMERMQDIGKRGSRPLRGLGEGGHISKGHICLYLDGEIPGVADLEGGGMRRRKRRLGRGWRRLAMHFIPLELENINI